MVGEVTRYPILRSMAMLCKMTLQVKIVTWSSDDDFQERFDTMMAIAY